MARREVQLLSLSTLDVLTGALGAVIFLFIIVPKGGASPSKQSQNAISYDVRQQKLWGTIEDSLRDKKVGDTLMVVITDNNELPQSLPCPECPQLKDCPPPIKCPECTRKHYDSSVPVPAGDTPQEKPQDKPQEKPGVKAETVNSAKEGSRKAFEPSYSCVTAFEVSWSTSFNDNVDIYVQSGKEYCGTQTKENKKYGLQWTSGKSRNGIFEKFDSRTTMESIIQFRDYKKGTFDLYARFKATDLAKPLEKLPITMRFYTMVNGVQKGNVFRDELSIDTSKKGVYKKLGTIVLDDNGYVEFKR